MPFSTSQRVQNLINLAREGKIQHNREVVKLVKLLALEPDTEALNDFEQVLTSKASRSLIDPFHPYSPVKGKIELGKAPEFNFGITGEMLRQNMLVVGQSGSGKTNLFYNVIVQLFEEKIPFWVFDFKQDFRHLLNYREDLMVLTTDRFKFNPLRPPEGVAPLRWIQIFADVFGDSQALLSGSKNFLVTHLHQLYQLYNVFEKKDSENDYPSMHELAELMHYKRFPLQTKEARYLETIMNRIKAAVLTIGDLFDCERGYPLQELLNRNVVFELEGISADFQNFLVEILLAWVYHYRMAQGSRNELKHAIFFDEAKRVFDKNKEKRYESGVPLIDLITARTREFGEALIVADQEASKLTDSIKANTFTKIMLASGSGKDIEEMAQAMGLTDKQIEVSYELEPGQGLVKVSGTDPFPVKFPLVPLQKNVSNSQVQMNSEEKLSKYQDHIKKRSKSDKYQEFIEGISTGKLKRKYSSFGIGSSSSLTDNKFLFLKSVAEKPFLFHNERYTELGLSGSKGNSVKKDLVRNNFLKETSIQTGKRGAKPKVVGLTKKGKEVLKEEDVEIYEKGKGGLEHRFWQQKIAQYFQDRGYQTKIEHELGEKAIDVYAENEKKIGIEVAMSPKGEVDNLEKDLELGLDELIVACKNEKVMSDIGVQARGYLGKEKIAKVEFKTLTYYFRI